MIKLNQRGLVNVLMIPLVLVVLCFIGAAAFGAWAYQNGQKYKNNSNELSAEAVSKAVQGEDTKKDAAFAQQAEDPLQTLNGPSAFGSLVVKYPKTWSAYVIQQTTNGSSTPLNAYFYPIAVPSVDDQTSTFSLRVEILNQSYNNAVQQFQNGVSQRTATVIPYSFPNVKSNVGLRVTGVLQNDNNRSGDLVIMPLRNVTLEIWTEGSQFESDFNNNILSNLSFSP